MLPIESAVTVTDQIELPCNAFIELLNDGWAKIGSNPYLDAPDDDTNYVQRLTQNGTFWLSKFTFEQLPRTDISIAQVQLALYFKYSEMTNTIIKARLPDSSIKDFIPTYAYDWDWTIVDITDLISTVEAINSLYIDLGCFTVGDWNKYAMVSAAKLIVDYNIIESQPPTHHGDLAATRYRTKIKTKIVEKPVEVKVSTIVPIIVTIPIKDKKTKPNLSTLKQIEEIETLENL